MEKVINIGDISVGFKSTGALPLRYKSQFKRELFTDIMKLEKSIITKNGQSIIDFDNFDTEIIYNLAWVCAKTYDNSILPPMEWLDSFEVFPLNDVITEIYELIINSMQTTKK